MAMIGVGAAELLLIVAMMFGGGGLSAVGTPLPPDAGLQAAAPPTALVYVAHYGMTKPDPKSSNHFEQMLAEPENQAFLAELNRLAEETLKLVPADEEPAKLLGKTLPTLAKSLIARPSILYVADVAVNPIAPGGNGAFVIHAGDQIAALRDVVEQWERFYLTQIPPNQTVEKLTIEGVEVRRLPMPPQVPPVSWGVSGEYLFVAAGEGEATALLKRLNGRGEAPAWLSKLTADAKLPRTSGLVYFNVAKAFELAKPFIEQAAAFGAPFDVKQVIDTLGLEELEYIAAASGLDESTAVSKLLVGHAANAKGVLTLLNGKPLSKEDLAGIPKSADFALAARIDGADIFQRFVDLVGAVDSNAAKQLEKELGQAEEEIGFGLKRDLLDGLGDVWTVYNAPTEGGALLTGMCATVSVRDQAKLERVIEQVLRIAAAEGGRNGKPLFALKKTTVGEQTISYLQFISEPVPVAPAWAFVEGRLIFSLSPQMVRTHLARPAAVGALADLEPIAKQIAAGGVTAVSYLDPHFGTQILYSYLQYGATMAAAALEKETGIAADLSKFPSYTAIGRHLQPSIGIVRSSSTVWSAETYATGPSIGPITVVAGMGAFVGTKAVATTRHRAQEVASSNNLRQLAIATALYQQEHNQTMPQAIRSKDGKPLLSWRVALLPYVDGKGLYEQFHLDEPWDSEHNRTLISKMPAFYGHPYTPDLRELGATLYQIPLSDETLYDEKGKVFKLPAGRQAVLFVEASYDQSIIWTQPDDLKLDGESPLDQLMRVDGGSVQAALTDGSVRKVEANGDSPEVDAFLKLLFPRKKD